MPPRDAAARAAFAHVPVAKSEKLADADAIIFGTSTRFGNMCAQMRNFLGHTGGLSMSGGIRRQGGQRVHQYREPAWRAGDNDHELPQHAPAPGHDNRRCAVFGAAAGGHDRDHRGTPYGASTITAADGSRLPSKNELAIARFQGRHVTEIAARLMR
jgi:multimeric flavodoxin WrbA